MPREDLDFSCPSAPPDSEDAKVFGVVLGDIDEPRVAYLERGTSVPEDLIANASDVVSLTRIFRFSGKCVNGACAQFKDGQCRLGADVAAKMDAVTDRIPACTIRATCRWFAENGPEVCLRCPRVVTTVFRDDKTLAHIATVGE
jgi:hypothetical protein